MHGVLRDYWGWHSCHSGKSSSPLQGGWLLQTSKDTVYNPMGSLPLVLITFNHGACVRTMCYLTDGSDPIKEINAISSLSPPPHTYIAGSLDHDLQTDTDGGGRYQ
jgi:hypothetical protein